MNLEKKMHNLIKIIYANKIHNSDNGSGVAKYNSFENGSRIKAYYH